MTAKLNEAAVKDITKTLQERFGSPLQETLIVTEGMTCRACGGMMVLEGDTCTRCGKMPAMYEATRAPKKLADERGVVTNPDVGQWAAYKKNKVKKHTNEGDGGHPDNDNDAAKPIGYEIVDTQSGAVVGKSTSRSRARQSADKRDLEYGAYRYQVRPVYA
jgi:hypothetical protein